MISFVIIISLSFREKKTFFNNCIIIFHLKETRSNCKIMKTKNLKGAHISEFLIMGLQLLLLLLLLSSSSSLSLSLSLSLLLLLLFGKMLRQVRLPLCTGKLLCLTTTLNRNWLSPVFVSYNSNVHNTHEEKYFCRAHHKLPTSGKILSKYCNITTPIGGGGGV